jgi:hypothetical protein
MVNRELDDDHYSEEVRKGWKDSRCYGLWSVKVKLLKMIEGRGEGQGLAMVGICIW